MKNLTLLSATLIISIICALFSLPTLSSDQPDTQLLQESPVENEDSNNSYSPMIISTPSSSSIFGISMDQLVEAQGIYPIANAGTNWTRRTIGWPGIEPNEGDRNWDVNFEQELINANQLGLTTIFVIDGTPAWALKSGFNCGVVDQNKFQAFANLITDMVNRYSVSPYNVVYWELWNEPDAAGVLGCWGDVSDENYYGGYYYGQMLSYVYPIIKAANPEAQVLVGGLLLDCDPNNPPEGRTCYESKFLQGILEAGRGSNFDGISFHAYDYYAGPGQYGNSNWNSSNTTGPVSIAKSQYITSLLAEYGDLSDKYLLNTETAIFYGPNVSDPLCVVDAPVDVEITKAYYVIYSYATSIAYNLRANLWYAALGGRCAAMFNSDLSPKPAFNAYKFAALKLDDAIYVRNISEYNGLMGYAYYVTGQKLWVLWSKDSAGYTIDLPATPLSVHYIGTDGMAVEESPSNQITVGISPYFIEFSN